ncbi:TIGR01459 family HAD-type hydrolase [uncultured Bartonella sp.]|uniref:TIGR01459 family HAD-type hydrolase n=1 Tax=uncultured Bartonella sp. TaxID=104108 RepID=UPI00261D6BA4|nr:TIGR01459 family HAD-type hydrolase [uncultured Bartonella sp.]
MEEPKSLEAIIDRYDAVFCDVWGVIHNGVHAFGEALLALKKARQSGKAVILITNSPRPRQGVVLQLASLKIGADFYDDIVTSGDATRYLIKEAPKKIFHIGPERDLSLFDGLDVELCEEFEAAAVVCTGLFDDENETPDDYVELLQRLRSRNLPFICANPDIIVHHGDKELWCAGALARAYEQLGGRTLIAGKPHRPIYDLAMKKLAENKGVVEKKRILAIGDGIMTDVKGGQQYGLDTLYISGGIHQNEYVKNGKVDPSLLIEFLDKFGSHPVATMWALK